MTVQLMIFLVIASHSLKILLLLAHSELMKRGGDDVGAVYVFSRFKNSWIQQAKLTANDDEVGDTFEGKVALTGGTASISANRDNDKGENSGSAYTFDIKNN